MWGALSEGNHPTPLPPVRGWGNIRRGRGDRSRVKTARYNGALRNIRGARLRAVQECDGPRTRQTTQGAGERIGRCELPMGWGNLRLSSHAKLRPSRQRYLRPPLWLRRLG